MIKLQEGVGFFYPDLLPKDNIYWPVCIMLQSMHTNIEGKTDNFHKNSYSEMSYWESKPLGLQ